MSTNTGGPTAVFQHRYGNLLILTLTYAWPNGKILRFALWELADSAVQSLLRICNSLYGQAIIVQDNFVTLDEGEVRDAAKFLSILEAPRWRESW